MGAGKICHKVTISVGEQSSQKVMDEVGLFSWLKVNSQVKNH